MFDFDAGKFLIIGVVALIVIGPKELPRVLRQVGQTVARVRRMAAEFQGQFMDAMKEADLDGIRDDLKKLGDEADLGTTYFDPARDIQRELTTALDKPAVAAAVPALAEVPDAPTHDFALPAALTEMPDEGTPTPLADAGAVPVADVITEPASSTIAPPEADGAGRDTTTARKRKIIVPRRRSPAAGRVHAVSDRTAAARSRAAAARSPELAGS